VPQTEPLGDVHHLLSLRKVGGQQLLWIETLLRHQPAKPAGGDAGNTARNTVAAKLLRFPLKQCNESLANLAEANDAEVIGADCSFSR
jgi:hypothetical protein